MSVLGYVASKTNRAIRVNLSLLNGYDREMLQSYSLVSANELGELGMILVELGYWHRANQAQHMKSDPIERNATLSSAPLQLLKAFENDETVNEFLFDLDEIVALDDDELGKFLGEKMGCVDGRRLRSFACSHFEVDYIQPIPLRNDPLSP